MQANRMIQLTLHEMLTVRFMPLPKFQGSHKGLPLDQLKIELTKICLNYIDMDMLLAEQGGVYGMIGTTCCTFIPNNTPYWMDGEPVCGECSRSARCHPSLHGDQV